METADEVGTLSPALGTGVWARTHSQAPGAVQLVHASHHMIPEDRIKIVLAPGQTTIESVLLLAQLERLEAKDKRGSEMRS